MPGGNKRSYVLKQNCREMHQVFLSTYDLLLPPGIKVLSDPALVILHVIIEPVARRRSVKKISLEVSQNLQESTCVRVFFLITLQVLGRGVRSQTLAQVFSCEFCEVFSFLYRTPPLAASAIRRNQKASFQPNVINFSEIPKK